MYSVSRGEMPKNSGSNSATLSMKPPHLTSVLLPGSAGLPKIARQSQRSAGISEMQSRPSTRLAQYSWMSRAIGSRALMPTTAIGSRRSAGAVGAAGAAGAAGLAAAAAGRRDAAAGSARAAGLGSATGAAGAAGGGTGAPISLNSSASSPAKLRSVGCSKNTVGFSARLEGMRCCLFSTLVNSVNVIESKP